MKAFKTSTAFKNRRKKRQGRTTNGMRSRKKNNKTRSKTRSRTKSKTKKKKKKKQPLLTQAPISSLKELNDWWHADINRNNNNNTFNSRQSQKHEIYCLVVGIAIYLHRETSLPSIIANQLPNMLSANQLPGIIPGFQGKYQ